MTFPDPDCAATICFASPAVNIPNTERDGSLGVDSVVAAYPKQLTDPVWKKVEKKGGVSATGVGQTLRDAEKVYKGFHDVLEALEQGKTDVAKVAPAQRAAAAALHKSEKTLEGVVQKVKNADKKKYLDKYRMFIGHIASEIEQFDPKDRRGLKFPLDRYNDRVKMWEKWVDV